MIVVTYYLKENYNRGFPEVDHSGMDAIIVLGQNKFTKKKRPVTGPVYSIIPCQLSYLGKC